MHPRQPTAASIAPGDVMPAQQDVLAADSSRPVMRPPILSVANGPLTPTTASIATSDVVRAQPDLLATGWSHP